uniref:Uncharacterized protein n=1 Tax=Anguilla anguilla TaxID=7936 RepID=A0A0E9TXC8_ANGAN
MSQCIMCPRKRQSILSYTTVHAS